MILSDFWKYVFRMLCVLGTLAGMIITGYTVLQQPELIPAVNNSSIFLYIDILLMMNGAGLLLWGEHRQPVANRIAIATLTGTVAVGLFALLTQSWPEKHSEFLTFAIVLSGVGTANIAILLSKRLVNSVNLLGNTSVWICGITSCSLLIISSEITLPDLASVWEIFTRHLILLLTGNALMIYTREYGRQRPGFIPRWKPNVAGMTAAVTGLFIWLMLIHVSRPVLSGIFLVITGLFTVTLTIMARFVQTARYRAMRLVAAQKEEARMLRELRHSRDKLLERKRQLEQNNRELALEIKLRRNAEKKLQESESRLQALFNTAADGIITIDEYGKIETINQAALKMFNFPVAEMIQENFSKLIPVLNDSGNHSDFNNFIRETLNQHNRRRELHGRRKNGDLFPLSMALSEVQLNDRLLYTAIIHDITARKKSEQRLRSYTAQLARTNQELKEFANVASHDLQEPLRKIRAFSDRIEQQVAGDEQSRDYLNRIQSAAERMQQLINDWLTFSRITTNAQPFSTVDLNKVTMEVLSDFEKHISPAQTELHFSGIRNIEADSQQIQQLLHNIIQNSIKFKNNNALKLNISGRWLPDSQHENNGQSQNNGLVELSIRDNGIGFDEKYIGKIFMLFQRLNSHSRYPGTGVGLAICQKIVERHGGYIRARSEPGKGTEIIVTLPVKQADRDSQHELSSESNSR
ncbi:MAG: ATP-binding protein [Calditrichia bacterium]|nr:PAS domain S-box protein [Calditrichota bacterium]MCB0268357.1 PAS domain S-box protein [Calditrichota bacterium]MCB9066711.1 PAS domain S-box protein [Calditrichia bacterium]